MGNTIGNKTIKGELTIDSRIINSASGTSSYTLPEETGAIPIFVGDYNATTNIPALANTDTNKKGVKYKVAVAGTQDFGAGNVILSVGDIVENDGTIWFKSVDNNQGGGSADDTPYDATTWDGNTDAPTKNAVRDKFESLSIQNFSPLTALSQGNNEFVIIATGIARTSNTPVNGALITWDFIDNATNHGYSFYTSVSGNPSSQGLIYEHPTVKNILCNLANGDESMVQRGLNFGARGEIAEVQYEVGKPAAVHAELRGINGTQTWSQIGEFQGNVVIDSYSNGLFRISRAANVFDFASSGVKVNYMGTNDYEVKRLTSGLAGSDYSFELIDRVTRVRVSGNVTTADRIEISNFGYVFLTEQMRTWNTSATSIFNNEWMDGFSNPWVMGIYELWLKVWTSSDTALHAKWQAKTGVTTYKLHRDVNADFSTSTQIYSGTDLQFLDTGLTADTMYYYRLDDQTDTEISRFWTKTRLTAHQN